jgi:hypothetical protein
VALASLHDLGERLGALRGLGSSLRVERLAVDLDAPADLHLVQPPSRHRLDSAR